MSKLKSNESPETSGTSESLDTLSKPPAFDNSAGDDLATVTTPIHSFGIRAADSEGHRNSASMLINKMYGWRGYGSGFTVGDRPNQITLTATDYYEGDAIGTLTVGLDARGGLLVDRLYHKEAQTLREENLGLCEFIKLAVDHKIKSKYLLASLFHVAFIYAHRLHSRDIVLIEVNPQHVSFYERLLHFEVYGEEKFVPRVNAPGVLLRLDLAHAADQIREFGGRGKNSSERSLYPYFFSYNEEQGITGRLIQMELVRLRTKRADEEAATSAAVGDPRQVEDT